MIEEKELQRVKDILFGLGEELVKATEQLTESFKKLWDSLEPYQRQELMHPRKKPRGSIRRNKWLARKNQS